VHQSVERSRGNRCHDVDASAQLNEAGAAPLGTRDPACRQAATLGSLQRAYSSVAAGLQAAKSVVIDAAALAECNGVVVTRYDRHDRPFARWKPGELVQSLAILQMAVMRGLIGLRILRWAADCARVSFKYEELKRNRCK
jgi:hypothetical protein